LKEGVYHLGLVPHVIHPEQRRIIYNSQIYWAVFVCFEFGELLFFRLNFFQVHLILYDFWLFRRSSLNSFLSLEFCDEPCLFELLNDHFCRGFLQTHNSSSLFNGDFFLHDQSNELFTSLNKIKTYLKRDLLVFS
jgi:hypothetical protein